MEPDPRSSALTALTRFQVTDASVGDTLQRIAEITLDAVPSAAVAGITMLGSDGRPTTAIYTDETSPEIDEAQYRSGSGPCLDAWRTRNVVHVEDVSAMADVYADFAKACLDHGVQSTLSLPLATGDRAIGALNLYARDPHAFTAGDEELAVELSGLAAVVTANVSAYWTAFELSQQLDEAMRSRAVIEQAKGMLMARSPDLSADDAFDLLRKASQRENVKLREIAARIVERREPPSEA